MMIDSLLATFAALRHKDTGCPWDKVQTFESIAPYTIEEAHEVVDAILENDPIALKEELGDLLLQVIYHARIAEELGLFSFYDISQTLEEKLIRRHPHVFGDKQAQTVEDVSTLWQEIKTQEQGSMESVLGKKGKGKSAFGQSLYLQSRVAAVGFDWSSSKEVLIKAQEELQELEEATASEDNAHKEEELGDLLFVLTNYARKEGIDPDLCLRRANQKFIRRFEYVETALKAEHLSPPWDLRVMEEKWQEAKFQKLQKNHTLS